MFQLKSFVEKTNFVQTIDYLKKILLIRFSSIGDIVLTTPVIRTLKQQLHCELHVLTKQQYASITQSNPNVDLVYELKNNLKEIISELRSEQYDFVVDLQKNARSVRIRKALRRPSASFPKLNREKWLMVNFKINRLPNVHVVDRYFEAVKAVNVKNDGEGLNFFIPEKDHVNPAKLQPWARKGYAGFVIGGRHRTKMLPYEKIVAIINQLKMPVILLGGPEDKENGDFITEATQNERVWNSCGRFNLNQSASLIKQAKVILTHDTGLMHIAAAFQKPIISIWGNTIPGFGMYPYMPDNKGKSIIAEVTGLNCRPCSKLGYKKCPKKHFKCMNYQSVDFIAESANRLYFSSIHKHRPARKQRPEKKRSQ